MKPHHLTTLETFKQKNYGKRGTKLREDLETGYQAFKIHALASAAADRNRSKKE